MKLEWVAAQTCGALIKSRSRAQIDVSASCCSLLQTDRHTVTHKHWHCPCTAKSLVLKNSIRQIENGKITGVLQIMNHSEVTERSENQISRKGRGLKKDGERCLKKEAAKGTRWQKVMEARGKRMIDERTAGTHSCSSVGKVEDKATITPKESKLISIDWNAGSQEEGVRM